MVPVPVVLNSRRPARALEKNGSKLFIYACDIPFLRTFIFKAFKLDSRVFSRGGFASFKAHHSFAVFPRSVEQNCKAYVYN